MLTNLKQIWWQTSVPVVFRQSKSDNVLIRIPFAKDNRKWLKGEHRRTKYPKWDKGFKCWRTPASWFDDVVHRCLYRFGSLYLIQPYREQQKCAPACWNAVSAWCECSCMGEHHGQGHPDGQWHIVAEYCAVSWGPKDYACRLLTPPNQKDHPQC